MIDLDKVMESASNVLQGVVDAMALTFFLVTMAHSYLGVEEASGIVFLKFGFSMGAFYSVKRLLDIYPRVVEIVSYNVKKLLVMSAMFVDVAREDGIFQAFVGSLLGSVAYDVFHELSKEVDQEDD